MNTASCPDGEREIEGMRKEIEIDKITLKMDDERQRWERKRERGEGTE